MQYKLLVNLFLPEIEEQYEIYIPINKTISDVTAKIEKLIKEQSSEMRSQKSIVLYNRYTGSPYDPGLLIRETDIRNGSELVALLIEKNETVEEATQSKKPEEAPILTVTQGEDDSKTISIVRKEQKDLPNLQKSTS